MAKKMGSPRNLDSPEEMLQLFEDYKNSLIKDAENWPKVQYVGKEGQRVEDYPKLPLTYSGLKVFAWKKGIGDIRAYFQNDNESYGNYSYICSCIKEEIRQDQITGGLLGVYNPSITQRLNGLTDKTQTTVNVSPKILNIDPLDDE